jgi:hypothetical protein
MQRPEVIEKTITVEVVPPHIQEHIALLQERQRQLTKERDSYLRQLEEERAAQYAHGMMDAEGLHSERVRALFAEAARDLIGALRLFLSKVPTGTDAVLFEGDDWQRVGEVRAALAEVTRVLEQLDVRTWARQSGPVIVEAGEGSTR